MKSSATQGKDAGETGGTGGGTNNVEHTSWRRYKRDPPATLRDVPANSAAKRHIEWIVCGIPGFANQERESIFNFPLAISADHLCHLFDVSPKILNKIVQQTVERYLVESSGARVQHFQRNRVRAEEDELAERLIDIEIYFQSQGTILTR